MRQRKAKDLDKRLQACREFLVSEPGPDIWDTAFTAKSGNDSYTKESAEGKDQAVEGGAQATEGVAQAENGEPGGLYLEIGCGKGQFIIKKAIENPADRFLAVEGQETVILRAAEKAMAVAGRGEWPENVPGEERLRNMRGSLDNLLFSQCFVNRMEELFRENQLAGVYLNFSDPWPKARHAKRRLTYHKRLLDYAWAIRPGGFIEIKTDNEGLFAFTLEEIRICEESSSGLRIVEMTRDLHGEDSACSSRFTTTEYEDKFSGRGKNINYVKLIVTE